MRFFDAFVCSITRSRNGLRLCLCGDVQVKSSKRSGRRSEFNRNIYLYRQIEGFS